MAFTSSVSSCHTPSTYLTPTQQGYCEGVVGRFAAVHVHFNGKLKTPIISKRSSSTSKSPRPRSLTPSRGQQSSQSPVPSISCASSREEDFSPHIHSTSSIPSVPNHFTLGHPHPFSETSPKSDASAESSHQDLLVAPSASYSSSSSVQESASPPTPSEPYPEPHLRDQDRPSIFSDNSHNADNVSSYHPAHTLRQSLGGPETLPSSKPRPGLPPDILGIVQVRPQSLDMPPEAPSPPSPPRMESPNPRMSLDNASIIHLSHFSAAMSDGAAGIGLSMLQSFLSGNIDDDEYDEDDDGDDDGEDYSDHEFSSQSDRERTSLEETVDGFPAPPTQIPTSSRATSFVLDAHRPVSSTSEYSEDGDGASLYDNYRYSRLSISSKMSKSSGYTPMTAPPPVPTELPLPVGHTQEPQEPQVPETTPPESLSPLSETTPVSPAPREIPQPTSIQATRTIPPPLDLGNSASGPEPSDFVPATVTSPLLHTTFGSPKSSPTDPNTTLIRSPVGAAFDFRGSGAASALRQKIELDRGISSPLPSPLRSTISDENTSEQSQSVIVKDEEGDMSGIQGTQPLSPTSPISPTVSRSSTTPEKMKRGGMAPLVVMNPAPPPPYSPSPRSPLSSDSFPTAAPTPTPAITHLPSQAAAEPADNALPRSLFPPHPNAPKPNLSPQGPLYGRMMELVPSLPSNSLIQAMRRAAQIFFMPNSFPRLSTIYGSTTQDLSAAQGPVPILFSIDPPHDIPAKSTAAAAAPAPAPVPTSVQNSLSPGPSVQQLPVHSQAAPANVIPRESFVPKAGAVRPRSRSFSGFDSPTSAGMPPKEQRSVLYLNFLVLRAS